MRTFCADDVPICKWAIPTPAAVPDNYRLPLSYNFIIRRRRFIGGVVLMAFYSPEFFLDIFQYVHHGDHPKETEHISCYQRPIDFGGIGLIRGNDP